MKRRDFLQGAAAAGLAGVSMPFVSRLGMAQTVIPVAGIHALSGAFANIGTPVSVGEKLGCDIYSQRIPFKLDFTAYDDGADPGRSVRRVQEAMQQKNTRCFLGTTTSANALAMAGEIHKSGGVYISQAGADEATGSECNKSHFRWPVATYGCIEETIRPLVKANPNLKRWYTITGQYVFGESLLRNARRVLESEKCELVGNSYHPLAEKEFSGYITNALAARPDVLCILNFGTATIDVVRQAVSFGMKRNTTILVPWSTGLDQYIAWGPDILEGIYTGIQYWHDIDSPGNRDFRKNYTALSQDAPGYLEATGYAVAQMLGEAVGKVKSADWREIITGLEGLEYDGICGREHVRAGDHQVLKDYYLMKGKAKGAMKDKFDYAERVSSGKSFLPVDQTGCKMA